MKIQTKISSIIFFIIFVTGVIAITGSYLISKQMLKENIYHHLDSLANSKSYYLETILNNDIELVLKTFATGTLLRNALLTHNLTLALQRINNLIKVYDKISRIRILDTQGKVLISSNKKIDYIGNAEIFSNGKEEVYIRDVHISTVTGTKVISISAPILNNGEFLGIVIINIEINETLYDIISHPHGTTGEIYIINKDRYLIASSRLMNNSLFKQKVEISEAIKCITLSKNNHNIEQKKIEIYKAHHGNFVIGTHRAIKKLDWCLLVEIDVDEAFAPVNRLVHIMLIILIILIGMGSIIAFFISKSIIHPILKLHRKSEEIEKGNWDFQVTIDSHDELGKLAKAFNSMTTQLKNAQNDLQYQTNFYANILDNIVDGVLVIDKNDIISYANNGVGVIVGKAPVQLVGRCILVDFPKDIRNCFKLYYLKAKESLKPIQYGTYLRTTIVIRQSYQSGWLIPQITKGKFSGMICTVTDITQQILAEKELKQYQDSLELKVIKRTAELQVVNEHLQQEIEERKQTDQQLSQHIYHLEGLTSLGKATNETHNIEQMMENAMRATLSVFKCDRAFLLSPSEEDESRWHIPIEITTPEYSNSILPTELLMDPEKSKTIQHVLSVKEPIIFGRSSQYKISPLLAQQFLVKSQLCLAIHPRFGKPWIFEMHQCSSARIWTKNELKLFSDFGQHIADILGLFLSLDALKMGELRWQYALTGSQDGILDWNIITNKIFFSPIWKSMLGFTDDEMRSDLMEWDKRVHPDDKEQAYLDIKTHLAGETEYYRNEHRLLCKDGTYKWILDRGKVVEFTKEGKPWRFVGTHSDITERREIEDKLSKSEKRYRRLFTDNQAIELLINPTTGKIVDFNKAAIQYYGYSEEELKSMRIMDINTLSPEEITHEMSTAEIEKRTSFSFKHRLASGEIRDVEVYSGPIELDNQHLLYSVIHDITAWKNAEEKLKQAKQSADSANRAKSEFLANMSHEIRTPLNAVIGFSELLSKMVTNKKHKSYLDSIQTAGKTLLTLINDILDLAKIEAGRLEIQLDVIEPRILFAEIEQLFALKIAEKGLTFSIEIENRLPHALILDENRLRQILLNLIGNAIKFTEQGTIKIRVKMLCKGDSIDLIIAVEDTGIGIPKKQQKHIFGAFQQMDGQSTRKYGGTGLGLTITKRLIEMMNGQIAIQSQVGIGSRFDITLHDVQVSDPSKTVKTDDTFDINTISFEPAKILVVDDIKSNRAVIRENLSQVNLEVIEAENGKNGLLFAQEYQPKLILMDIRMPVMDGYETTTFLKNNPITKNIPVIALTASVMHEKINMHEFDDFLSKPVQISKLLKKLSQYLKYNIKPVKQNTKQEDIPSLSLSERKKLPELMNKLEQLIPKWESFKGALDLDVVEEFANEIIALGTTYHISYLTNYGENLCELAHEFESTKIRQLLNKFLNLRQQLKGL